MYFDCVFLIFSDINFMIFLWILLCVVVYFFLQYYIPVLLLISDYFCFHGASVIWLLFIIVLKLLQWFVMYLDGGIFHFKFLFLWYPFYIFITHLFYIRVLREVSDELHYSWFINNAASHELILYMLILLHSFCGIYKLHGKFHCYYLVHTYVAGLFGHLAKTIINTLN